MALTLEEIGNNAAANAVVDLLDGGSVEYQTAADAVVATLGLGTPAFGDAATGAAAANAITSDTNTNAGDVAKAVWKNSQGTTIFTCSVTANGGGGDIEFAGASVTFAAGETAELSSFTYTDVG